jgi:hypothetical protein
MNDYRKYLFEYLFLASVMALAVAGFWDIYLGADSNPTPYHHLHLATNFIWLFLLSSQLSLVGTNKYESHRKVGLSVLVFAPLLVASTALLSVHSAQKGLASGRGDFMIVQNVGTTLELGLLILLAFVLRKRRRLHGSIILSTAMLFMGIALFFTMISFVPAFRIEGPETFYRFQTAGATGRYVCLAVGTLFFVKDFRNGWPMLLAASFFSLNELIKSFLTTHDLLDPLTAFVGSMSQPFVFGGSFLVVLGLLAATGILSRSAPDRSFKPKPLAGSA